MATDITQTDNYKGLASANQTLVDTAVAAITAAYAGALGEDDKTQDNMYMIFKEIIEQQETS